MANRGGPGNPLSTPELCTKFTSNATRTLSSSSAAQLGRLILDGRARGVSEIAAAAAPDRLVEGRR
jgi:hypothetical protein